MKLISGLFRIVFGVVVSVMVVRFYMNNEDFIAGRRTGTLELPGTSIAMSPGGIQIMLVIFAVVALGLLASGVWTLMKKEKEKSRDEL